MKEQSCQNLANCQRNYPVSDQKKRKWLWENLERKERKKIEHPEWSMFKNQRNYKGEWTKTMWIGSQKGENEKKTEIIRQNKGTKEEEIKVQNLTSFYEGGNQFAFNDYHCFSLPPAFESSIYLIPIFTFSIILI